MSDKLTRDEAARLVGIESVEAVALVPSDFTGRALEWSGAQEFAANLACTGCDGEPATLSAYYYQNNEDLQTADDLGDLDWEVDHYRVH